MKFKRQNYHKNIKLGIKWRRPKGRQSKMRRSKGGAGKRVRIGYGTSDRGKIKGLQPVIVNDPKIMDSIDKDKCMIIISSGLGAKKALAVSEKAKKFGLKIMNSKKIKRAEKLEKSIEENCNFEIKL